jgi:hypothetical protein
VGSFSFTGKILALSNWANRIEEGVIVNLFGHSGKWLLSIILILIFWGVTGRASGQDSILVLQNEAWADFPESVDFHLEIDAASSVESAELEYGIVALSCGNVTAVTTPPFEQSQQVNLTWRWDILKEQIVPPGADIWWQWHIVTVDGSELTTSKQTLTFLDSWFVWQTVSQENLNVHWYRGSKDMANQILQTGVNAIHQLANDTGLNLTDDINLYLYEEPFDLQISVPGAPDWAGGAAFPENSLILAVAQDDYLNYSMETVRHEIGHLVTERLAFNCLQPLPTWLC